MNYRTLNILMLIAQQIQNPYKHMDDNNTDMDMKTIMDSLQHEGYSRAEIESAIKWFFDYERSYPQLINRTDTQTPRTFRILHPFERLYISPEAYGFLIQMRQLGLINDLYFEQVIERVIVNGVQADLPMIRAITSSVILDPTNDDRDIAENWSGFLM